MNRFRISYIVNNFAIFLRTCRTDRQNQFIMPISVENKSVFRETTATISQNLRSNPFLTFYFQIPGIVIIIKIFNHFTLLILSLNLRVTLQSSFESGLSSTSVFIL